MPSETQRGGMAGSGGTSNRRSMPGLAACLTALLSAACGPAPLAEAGGHRLTVDDAAQLIAENSTIPGDSQVVRVVAELWVDYTLLAIQLSADTSLGSLDVGLLTEQPLEEGMLARLRDDAVEVDTVVTDAELTVRFAADMPGARATASQILLPFPRSATTRQRDSVLAVATGLRAQLARGDDFASLASVYSGDPGSGRRGGSMGTFGRGEMLAPIDETVFRLQPGELSDPVETALGYHLLRLDALDVPALSEVGDEFRRRIQLERTSEAESAYIMQLDSAAGLSLGEDALEITRALAGTAPSRLSSRAAVRPLLTWAGGVYSAGDFLELFRISPDGFAEGVVGATDEELEMVLLRLGRQELLIEEARAQGFAPTDTEVDSVAAEARAAIRSRAELIGLVPRDAAADSTADSGAATVPATVEEIVEGALIRIVSGEQEILPLGGVILLLRDQGTWRIDDARIRETAARLEEVRSP